MRIIPGGFGVPGMGRNEWLLEGIEEQREYIDSLHRAGIVVLMYQSDCNFDRVALGESEAAEMAAELDPFAWAFGTVGRTFACVNKKRWREYIADRLEIRIGDYGSDGVFLDNSTPFIHCRCDTCRSLYRERFGQELFDDMGRPETVVADMRVFDYALGRAVPKNLARIDNHRYMRYLEWRIERIVDFYKDLRKRVETRIGRDVLWTSNGHIGIAEFTGINLADTFDMIFSEEGFTAPPASNAFALRLGTAVGRDERCMLVLTRVLEGAPTADMVSALSAEGRALGGQATFWDFHLRADERLANVERTMRAFFIDHADDLFAVERDANDVAVLMSYRSDLWTGQAISPARHVADLLEDLNQPYDILLVEREADLQRLWHKLVIAPHVEILPQRWFEALRTFVNKGGEIISTGNTAALDENLTPRTSEFRSARFTDRVEKEYADQRKPISFHQGFTVADMPFVNLVKTLLRRDASVLIDPPVPLLTINHTHLPDGEAIHLVNRHVNIFTRIHLRSRDGLKLRFRPARPTSYIRWLTPDAKPERLTYTDDGESISIQIPTLRVYGIVRIYYGENHE
jgi:hypothetical protein